MTETTMFEINESEDSQVAQWYKRLMNQTIEIDERLDAGSEAATKRAFTTGLMKSYEPSWAQNAGAMEAGLKSYLDAGELEKFAGVYLGLVRTLTNTFSKQYNAYVEAEVAKLPKPEETEQITPEERGELSKERQELVKQIKTIVDMAKTFNEPNAETWAMPPKKGSSGPRGKRALYSYNWTIDGQSLPDDDDNPKGVSVKLGFEKVSEFTQALKDAKINTTTPPAKFTVEIAGKTIIAEREEAEDEAEETPAEETAAESE